MKVGHCVFVRATRLDSDRFEKLVESFSNKTEFDNLLHYLYNVPRMIRRGMLLGSDSEATDQFIRNIESICQALTSMRQKLRDDLDNVLLTGDVTRLQISAEYAFTLSVCSIYHCVLRGPKLRPVNTLARTNALVVATLQLAKEVEDLSPLGSAYMFMTLSTARLCCEDATEVLQIESATRKLLQNYHRDGDVAHLVLRIE
jgi:hypothetical protein